MVAAGLKSDTWVQTLIPLMSMAEQVPSPWALVSPFGKGEGGPLQSEVLKPMRDNPRGWGPPKY